MTIIKKVKTLWPEWTVGRMIGEGSFGAVCEMQREMFGSCETAALKVLSIPQKESDVEELLNDGYAEESIRERYAAYMKDIAQGYKTMAAMKGHANIVCCDDLRYLPHENGIGGVITIKMESLTPLPNYLSGQTLVSDKTVIDIGIDICNALSVCRRNQIIHRDIRPQNIFVSQDGKYKLGDFCIAGAMEGTSSGIGTGTYKYMAPEVYNNNPYGAAMDIYSLGMVLYWLLNERRAPFLPLPPETTTYSQEKQANAQRFSGKTLPTPAHGSDELKAVILKACAYHPEERYADPEEMKKALEGVGRTISIWDSPMPEPVRKKNKYWIAITAVLAAVALGVGLFVFRDQLVGTDDRPAMEQLQETDPKIDTQDGKLPAKPSVLPDEQEVQEEEKTGRSSAAEEAILLYKEGSLKSRKRSMALWETIVPKKKIAAGFGFSLGIDVDQRIILTGESDYGADNVSKWENMVSISSSDSLTFGLRAYGGVQIASDTATEYSGIDSWSDIVAVEAGSYHVVGLCADGTVKTAVRSPSYNYGQEDADEWETMIAVEAEDRYTAGLKADGTVLTAGQVFANLYLEESSKISQWNDIVEIAAAQTHMAGLRSDGTVIAVGANENGQCEVADWDNIIAIDAAGDYTIGLREDGTVMIAGLEQEEHFRMGGWENIIEITAGTDHILGRTKEGYVRSAGGDTDFLCATISWSIPDTENNNADNRIYPASDEELLDLATAHFEQQWGYRPKYIEVEHYSNNEQEIVIHFYDATAEHTVTADWYIINRYTGNGTNFMGNEFVLLLQ